MDAISGIDLSLAGSPSLVMQDLAEYSTLPFLAAFDVQSAASSTATDTPTKSMVPQKRITYIGLVKKTMPMLVDLFLKFKPNTEIYVDGTLEAVLSVSTSYCLFRAEIYVANQAYSIPIKLKYDCPPPSKFGHDRPLWKTATTCFLRIVKECTQQIKSFGAGGSLHKFIIR